MTSALAREHIPFELELHSELLQKDTAVRPDDPAFKGRIDELLQLRPEQDPFADFAVFPGLKRYINEPAMTCIERLATADMLVMSKSSFSYSGGDFECVGHRSLPSRSGTILWMIGSSPSRADLSMPGGS